MEKLFEVVGSLIPGEQKADIKAKFDGELSKVLKDNEVSLKKELSAKYDVNFYEEDLSKAYSNKSFIKAETYNELKTKFDEQSNAIAELNKERETFEIKLQGFEKNESLYNSQINLIGNGLRYDRLELVKPHLTGDVEKDLESIKTSYPEMFSNPKQKGNLFPKVEEDGKTDMQKYFEKRKAK